VKSQTPVLSNSCYALRRHSRPAPPNGANAILLQSQPARYPVHHFAEPISLRSFVQLLDEVVVMCRVACRMSQALRHRVLLRVFVAEQCFESFGLLHLLVLVPNGGLSDESFVGLNVVPVGGRWICDSIYPFLHDGLKSYILGPDFIDGPSPNDGSPLLKGRLQGLAECQLLGVATHRSGGRHRENVPSLLRREEQEVGVDNIESLTHRQVDRVRALV
jgi:hypothetical protein